MKKNLFFDVGQTLAHPKTGNWFITPNFYNILGDTPLRIAQMNNKNHCSLNFHKAL